MHETGSLSLLLFIFLRKLEKRHTKIYFVSSSKTKHSCCCCSTEIIQHRTQTALPQHENCTERQSDKPKVFCFIHKVRLLVRLSDELLSYLQHEFYLGDTRLHAQNKVKRLCVHFFASGAEKPAVTLVKSLQVLQHTHTVQNQGKYSYAAISDSGLDPYLYQNPNIRHVSLRSVVPAVRWLLDASVVRTCRTSSEAGQNNQSASRLLLLIITLCDCVFFLRSRLSVHIPGRVVPRSPIHLLAVPHAH